MEGDGRQGSRCTPRILLNISRSYYELEDYTNASTWYDKAAAVDPGIVRSFEYLKSGQGGGNGSRAALQSGPQILFAPGEE